LNPLGYWTTGDADVSPNPTQLLLLLKYNFTINYYCNSANVQYVRELKAMLNYNQPWTIHVGLVCFTYVIIGLCYTASHFDWSEL